MRQLSTDEKKELISLVRKVIEEKLFAKSKLLPKLDSPIFKEKKGAFVTIRKLDNLRGCIGVIEAKDPLNVVIERMAYSSAFEDPRFSPLTREEYPNINIEISVLSKPHKVNSPNEVIVGKHGIIISHDHRRGLLLPQVAVENNWDREEFLNHGCIKAYLAPDKWKDDAIIEVFEADVFSEKDFNKL